VTSLSAGPGVHQGPSTYSSCSTSLQYCGAQKLQRHSMPLWLLAALYPISPSLSSRFDICWAMEYNRSVCVMTDTQEDSEPWNFWKEARRCHEKQ